MQLKKVVLDLAGMVDNDDKANKGGGGVKYVHHPQNIK